MKCESTLRKRTANMGLQRRRRPFRSVIADAWPRSGPLLTTFLGLIPFSMKGGWDGVMGEHDEDEGGMHSVKTTGIRKTCYARAPKSSRLKKHAS